MNNTKFLNDLGKAYQKAAAGRRQLSDFANQAQALAKQAIFAAQRGNLVEANTLLKKSEGFFQNGKAVLKKVEEIEYLGSWRAALEEYVEAKLFVSYLETKKIVPVTGYKIPTDVYLGAISDLLGELARYAVKQATSGDKKNVQTLVEVATVVVGELAAMNLTGSLRSKFDQAKQHLRKLEDIQYDLSLRRHD